ncbi:uncharacterized protein LOC144144873 [Haemaphysalis longicornis]|uniref:Uncharacterized protein n=1 Tax=Haemaphysalis longicornis TaxID=44386 RepID=A0A9J6H7B3_HAELO|nr:hypothetical protein HPB48_024006 [Haemaphysalis longicornis]
MAASNDTTPATSPVALRKPRKWFCIDADLCLLREVATLNPFENPDAWGDVLKNVTRAVQRELTIRSVKERVDLLVGYFRHEDRANLRRSGTEEQYGEREQLLQEISDLMNVLRTLPRTANGTGLLRPPLSSAAARQRAARQFRDSVTAAIAPLVAPNDGHMIGN